MMNKRPVFSTFCGTCRVAVRNSIPNIQPVFIDCDTFCGNTPHTKSGLNMPVEIIPPDELVGEESTPGIVRKTVFETDNNVMVYSRVAGNTTTAWHHHCDRHAYGYILHGQGAIEYGSCGSEQLELSAPLFFQISPGIVHREITNTEMEVIVSFVGSGPLFENVDGPE